MTDDLTRPTIDEAVELLTDAAFTITDAESADCGRVVIHCFAGPFGADWDLCDAIALIRRADEMAWLPSWTAPDHDLAVLCEGRVKRFAVKQPTGGAS